MKYFNMIKKLHEGEAILIKEIHEDIIRYIYRYEDIFFVMTDAEVNQLFNEANKLKWPNFIVNEVHCHKNGSVIIF